MLRSLLAGLILSLPCLVASRPTYAAQSAAKLDLSAWQQLPVLHEGRMMPLDSFARKAAQIVCKRDQPTLGLEGAVSENDFKSDTFARARKLFGPNGKARKFDSSELLLSWLVEPQAWEHVPFLHAEHDELRKMLGAPVMAEWGEGVKGAHLRFVSPAQVQDSEEFQEAVRALDRKQQTARANKEPFQAKGLDRKIEDLMHAYTLFRQLTFHPLVDVSMRGRFRAKAELAVGHWQALADDLGKLQSAADPRLSKMVAEVESGLRTIAGVADQPEIKIEDVEPTLIELRASTAQLAKFFAKLKERLFSDKESGGKSLKSLKTGIMRLTSRTESLARTADDMQWALYDNGESLRIEPSLDPAVLTAGGDMATRGQPWVTLQTLLFGSKDLLSAYPQDRLQQLRAAFSELGTAYIARDDSRRVEKVASGAERLLSSARVLGQETTALRDQLKFEGRDDALLAVTGYPEPVKMERELEYNRIDPFAWSWRITLFSSLAFALSFGKLRRPMFVLGLTALIASLVWTAYGFALRIMVTGWAPVTGMYETVIYVPFFASALGVWFALIPLSWPGLSAAWHMTAIPGFKNFSGRQHDSSASDADAAALARGEQAPPFSPKSIALANWALLIPRLALSGLLCWLLAIAPYTAGGGPAINLLPARDYGASLPGLNSTVVWIVGLSMLVTVMWLGPRAVLALIVGTALAPKALAGRWSRQMELIFARWPFALASSLVATFLYLMAWYAPILDRGFNPLMPVLRDNFWLTIHVLTIVSSYGAGMLAWALGNLALCFYLFGNYRAPLTAREVPAGFGPARHADDGEVQSEDEGRFARRPPEACGELAGFVYRATQVAIILLAAGTILGGLWADVSWGRFWGWDPKEVWALISLLAYLAILHGRYAGYFNNFGLAAGAVLGASAIAMSWYGVNFVLGSGMHAYAAGEGGQTEVGLIVIANWIFLGLAFLRYRWETRSQTPLTA